MYHGMRRSFWGGLRACKLYSKNSDRNVSGSTHALDRYNSVHVVYLWVVGGRSIVIWCTTGAVLAWRFTIVRELVRRIVVLGTFYMLCISAR